MMRSKYTERSNGGALWSSDWLQYKASVEIIYMVYFVERNKQSVIRPALKLCFIYTFPIMAVHYYIQKDICIYLHKDTHSLIQKLMRHYFCLQQSHLHRPV